MSFFFLLVFFLFFFFFFFSSRRRHTRFSRDWSSDVCSSDLGARLPGDAAASTGLGMATIPRVPWHAAAGRRTDLWWPAGWAFHHGGGEIGRASCRERV